MSKLISTFKIGFDDETKAVMSELKDKLDAITGSLGVPSALLGSTKPNGGLLVAMSEAANDAPEPELKQMGQWVFEGQGEEWVSAAWDGDGGVWLFKRPSKELKCSARDGYFFWYTDDAVANKFVCYLTPYSEMNLDSIIQKLRLIDRETVNDVDYLSETVPEIQGMEASDIIIDEMGRDYSHNSNCLHAVVPQITQADMQHIFIKNLSDVLIQRMHSMDRFSEDDYAIGGDDLMAWDILIYEPLDAYAVLMRGPDQINVADLLLIRDGGPMADAGWNTTSEAFAILRTITEAELPAFRAALEACYV